MEPAVAAFVAEQKRKGGVIGTRKRIDNALATIDEAQLATKAEKAKALENVLINLLSSNLAKPNVEDLEEDIKLLTSTLYRVDGILGQAHNVLSKHTKAG